MSKPIPDAQQMVMVMVCSEAQPSQAMLPVASRARASEGETGYGGYTMECTATYVVYATDAQLG